MRSLLGAVFVVAALFGSVAYAQSERSLYQQAEDLRLGINGPVDLGRALELHKESADLGRDTSLVRMASIYIEMGDHEKAIQALERGIVRGHQFSKQVWAGNHISGKFGELSVPESGVLALRELIAETDKPWARYRLARAYEFGTGVDRDMEAAIAEYERLADENYAPALKRLADFALRGTAQDKDLEAAVALYQKAIDAGDNRVWLSLAQAHLATGDAEAAFAAYQSAIDNDIAGAEAEFARLHFLGEFADNSDKAFGAKWLETQAEEGDLHAAMEAIQLWERRSRRINTLDLDSVLATIKSAADNGDRRAAQAYLRALRVLRWKIPGARAKHAAAVQTYRPILSGNTLYRELFFATYDRDNHSKSTRDSVATVRGLGGDEFVSGAMGLRSNEFTAFVYLVQAELRDLGLYSGPITGRATSSTIRAMLRLCRDAGVYDTCIHGPLLYNSSYEISRAIAERRNVN
ncbi:tetratricopeptide repeat protein [Cognatishimia maritima]|nr:tetratricopeptide repeat protein [Cognatishimia maritima]